MLCSSPGTMSTEMSNYMSGTMLDSGCGRMPSGLAPVLMEPTSIALQNYEGCCTAQERPLNPGGEAGHGGPGGPVEEVRPKLKSDG